MNSTKATKKEHISREWHIIDVKDQILGRVAVDVAKKLMGKEKAYFVRNMDCGDYVVVVNSKYVRVTGKKEVQKTYGQYSGYPGGLKKKALWQLRQEKPNDIIRNAVYGMLPKNKLRDKMITRLFVYPDETHPHESNVKNAKNV